MYYQYNPNNTIAGNQHWGHATSSDLLHWNDQPIAIFPTKNGGLAFSGSMVNDVNNTSGFFESVGEQNFVAVFTRAQGDIQEQVLQYSKDGGKSFIEYANNPVLNVNASQFRDPQVQWLQSEQKWVMTIALSRDHFVQFYESKDLKTWTKLSEFRGGILGVDYECPNLVPLLDEHGNKRWVLFLSINPGMPLGGSGTQYFVGDFNGTHFVPEEDQNAVTLFVDIGKDNYALQHINPGNQVNKTDLKESSYIGWFGNWQYCQETPTGTWRGAMTLARKLSLKRDWLGVNRLVQSPKNLESLRECKVIDTKVSLNHSSKGFKLPNDTTAVEIIVNGSVTSTSSSPLPGTQRVYLDISNGNSESLQIGLETLQSQLWIDRSNLNGFKDPFLTGKFSAALQQPATSFEWRIILDSSLLELYTEDGLTVASLVYFADSPLTDLTLSIPNGGKLDASVRVYPLKKSMQRETVNN